MRFKIRIRIIVNPSEEYAKLLQRQGLDGILCTVKIIQVNSNAVAEFVDALNRTMHTEHYDAVVMLGVAGDASNFRIELLAKGIKASLDDLVDEKAVPRLLTTLNMSCLCWCPYLNIYSFDAGSYYCNQLYYDVLELIYKQNITSGSTFLPAVFIHVPPFEQLSVDEGISSLKNIIMAIVESTQ